MKRKRDKETPMSPVMIRVPEKPDGQSPIIGAYIGCPRCERNLSIDFEYCPRCGQHIKWK